MPTSTYKLLLEEGNEVERHLFYNAIGGKDACMTFKIYLNNINTGKVITDQVVKLVGTLIYSESGQPVLKPNVFEIRDANQLIIDHSYPAIIKFRINEVSSHHQGQKFKLKVSPMVVDGDNNNNNDDLKNLEPVYSLPIEVRSKIVKSVRSRAAAEESNEVNATHNNQQVNKKIKHEFAPNNNNNNNNFSTKNGTSSIDILAQIASNASVPLLSSQLQQQKPLSPTHSPTNNMKEESIINPKQHQNMSAKASLILPSPAAVQHSHSPSTQSPTSTTSNSRQLPNVVSMDYPNTTATNNTTNNNTNIRESSSSSTLESVVASIIPITKSVKDHLMSVQIKDENSHETSFYYSLLQKTALFLNDMEILARMIQNDKDKERKDELKKQQIQQQQELLLFQQQQQQLQQLHLVQLQKEQQQYEHQQQQQQLRLYPYNSHVDSSYAYTESKYDDKRALSPTTQTQTQVPFATSSTGFTFKPIVTTTNSNSDLKNMSKKQRAKEFNKQQAWSGSNGNNNINSSGNSRMNSSHRSSSTNNLLPPPLLPSFYTADTKSKSSSPTTHFTVNNTAASNTTTSTSDIKLTSISGNSDNKKSIDNDDDDDNKLTYQQSGVTDVCDDDCHTSSEDDEDEEESSSQSNSQSFFERQHSQPV